MFAQTDNKSGYIITNSNEKITGLISLKNEYLSSKKCVFKSDSSEDFVTYTPDEILEYGSEGVFLFRSREVKTDKGTEMLFLDCLVDGISDLYFLPSDEEPSYFLEKNGEINILKQDISIIEAEGGGRDYQKKSDKYKGVFMYLYADAQSLYPLIKKSTFSHNSLIKVAKKYHELTCDEYECRVYTPQSKSKVYIEPMLGYGIGKSQIGRDTGLEVYRTNRLITGTYITATMGRFRNRFGVSSGLLYRKVKESGKFKIIGTNANQINFEYEAFMIPILINRRITIGKSTLSLGAGLIFTRMIGFDKSDARITYETDREDFVFDLNFPNESYMGFIGRVGWIYDLSEKIYARLDMSYLGSQSSYVNEVFLERKNEFFFGSINLGFKVLN
ncbi:MAG: hypothetical protein JXR03_02375 [Cyclobacteriaceae bacterium]